MDPRLREYLIMTAVSAAVAIILSSVSYMIIGPEDAREYAAMGSMVAGAAAGLTIVFLLRKRDIFYRRDDSPIFRLQEVSATLSFLSVTPTAVAILATTVFSDPVSAEFPLISAIMVFISMLIQAVFWRKVSTAGYLSPFGNYMLSIALILMNISALLAINCGGAVMFAVSILATVSPILLMFDWDFTVDKVVAMTIVSAVVSITVTVISGGMFIGEILVFLIPMIIMVLYRNSLKGTSLVYDGQRMF